MYPIQINTMAEFNQISAIGFNPLIDWIRFRLDYKLRLEIQHSIFGKNDIGNGDIVKANLTFYRYCWDNSRCKVCEECIQPLWSYSAKYISHILSRSNYPELAHDPRNFNLLCPECHHKWESNNTGMKIRKRNKVIVSILLSDLKYY